MACSGKCTITKSEYRKLKIGRVQKSDPECPKLGDRKKKIVDQYLARILADAFDGCAPCDCDKKEDEEQKSKCHCKEIPDQKPTPGPWEPYTKVLVRSYKRNGMKCVYKIPIKLEIRKRVFEGICYDVSLPD